MPTQAGEQLIRIKDTATGPTLWQCYCVRNLTTYPLTDAGDRKLEADIMSGKLELRLDNGAVIPAGTVPGRIPPVPAVGWLSQVRITYDAQGLLYIEVSGNDSLQANLKRKNGQNYSGSNPDGVPLNSNDWYGYGNNPGQGALTKQWRYGAVPAEALQLSFRLSTNPTEIVTYSFTPVVGDNKRVLTAGSGSAGEGESGSVTYGATYTYNGSILRIEGTDINLLLRFQKASLQAFVTTNPDNVRIDSETFYQPAVRTGTHPARWEIYMQNAPEMLLTFKLGNATFQKSFIPETGSSGKVLFTAGVGAANCNFSVSVNSPTIQPGGQATLTATVSGPDSEGVTLLWSNGQTGNSIIVNPTNSQTYTVTATKTNCNPVTAAALVTVSGTGGSGGAGTGNDIWGNPNSSYVAKAEQGGRPGYGAPSWLNNGSLWVGITVTAGDVITHVKDNENGISCINNPFFSANSQDYGRQLMDAAYDGPNGSKQFRDEGQGAGLEELGEGPYIEPAPYNQRTDQYKGGPNGNGSIGWNPVEGGDEAYKGTANSGRQKASPVLTHHISTDGRESYNKTQPLQWDLDNVPGKMYMEKWIRFDPTYNRAIRVHRRWTLFRDDPAADGEWTYRDQEAPCAYLESTYNQYFVCRGEPYKNVELSAYPMNADNQQAPVHSTEGAIFAYSQFRNKWVCLYAPGTQFSAAVFGFTPGGQPDQTGPESFQAGYISFKPAMHLDRDGVYDLDYGFAMGNSVAELRAWLYNQPRMTGTFSYRFNNKSRLGWHFHHGRDQRERNITNGLIVTPINHRRANFGKDLKIKAPFSWVNGRVVKNVWMKLSAVADNGNMLIGWTKVNDPTEYKRAFSFNANAGDQVVNINMNGVNGWDGQDIVHFWFEHEYPSEPTEQYTIKWIASSNLDA